MMVIYYFLPNVNNEVLTGSKQSVGGSFFSISRASNSRSKSFSSAELRIESGPGIRSECLPQFDTNSDVFISAQHTEIGQFPPHRQEREDKQKEMCLCSNL